MSKNINVSFMGSSALDSHVAGSKHIQKVKSCYQGSLETFFKKTETREGEKDASSSKSSSTTLDFSINQSTLDAEILS